MASKDDEEEWQRLLAEYEALGGAEDLSVLGLDDAWSKLADLRFQKTGTSVPSPATGVLPVGALTDDELGTYMEQALQEAAPYANPLATQPEELLTEYDMRQATQGRNFVQNLTDPETMAWAQGRLAKQFAAGAMNAIDLPAQAAGLYGLGSLGAEELAKIIAPNEDGYNFGASEALDFANERYQAALNAAGVTEPRELGESIANLAGSVIPVPGPKITGPVANALEIMTPLTVGGGAPRLAVNLGVSVAADQSMREFFDKGEDDYETAFDLFGVPESGENFDVLSLSTLAAAMTVPMFAPAAVRALGSQKTKMPTVKALTDLNDRTAPENLFTITTTGDLNKSYILDDKQPLVDIAERAGVPDLDALRTAMDMDTQAAGVVRVNEALATGKMHTKFGDFTAPVAPRQIMKMFDTLPATAQADVDRYLKLGDYMDTIRRRMAAGIKVATDQTELASIQKARADMRKAYPELGSFSQAYQEYTGAVRSYLAQGPYAILDPKSKQSLDRDQPHYVPMNINPVDETDNLLKRITNATESHLYSDELAWLQKRSIEDINMNTQNMRMGALPSGMAYGESALKAQLHNNARGVFIDQLMQSKVQRGGKPLIRLASKDEIESGKYNSRLIKLWRNGKEETYISGDRLIAHTLKFDPYVLNNPLAMMWYGQRRLFEQATTGVASLTFAPTTGIRDTIAGWANTKKGEKGPSIVGAIAAPASILGAKAMRAFYEDINARLETGGKAWYLPGMTKQGQEQLAARLAATYQNTLYHAAQEFGGFDASMMKDRIQVARGALAEVAKSLPSPVSRTYKRAIQPLLAGFSAIYDSMQEAPRYDAFVRNVKDGKGVDEAITIARNITGDTLRSGRIYDNEGKRIVADVVNPEMAAGHFALGPVIEAMRLGIPYLNPALQGMRRSAIAAASDPLRFSTRAWLSVGLPSVAMYAWNRMLTADDEGGNDYIDYQFNKRTSRDQVMEMYMGIPGKPPEQGISIPIAHEMTPFMAPMLTFLNHMDGSSQELQDALVHTGLTIADTAAGIGTPPAINAFMNLTGQSAPDQLFNPSKGVYDIKEDSVGILNENIEQAIRSQFGALGSIGLEVAAALAEDGELSDGFAEFQNSIGKRIPIVKGLAGWKTNSSSFTPLSAAQKKKMDAYNQFDRLWTMFYDQEGVTGDLGSVPPLEFTADGQNLSFPFANVGPNAEARPTNPLYGLIGQQVHDAFEKKEPYGFTTTKAQMGILTDQIRLLRGYNSGRADDFKAWQETLENAGPKLEEAKAVATEAVAAYEAMKKENGGPGVTGNPDATPVKDAKTKAEEAVTRYEMYLDTAKFLEDNNIDLSNRFDSLRLTNLLEGRRVDLMKSQLEIIKQVEDDLTAQLQADGILPPGEQFSLEKYLQPAANPVPAAGLQ